MPRTAAKRAQRKARALAKLHQEAREDELRTRELEAVAERAAKAVMAPFASDVQWRLDRLEACVAKIGDVVERLHLASSRSNGGCLKRLESSASGKLEVRLLRWRARSKVRMLLTKAKFPRACSTYV